MTIGERMRESRLKLNIKPKDIADKIGKSVSTYYRYETNEIEKLTISKMCEIAEHLNISPIYLAFGLEPDTSYDISQNVDINNHIILAFSKHLKDLMRIYNYSSYDLLEKLTNEFNLKLTIKDIHNWENGIQSPDIISLNSLSELFNVSPSFLLGAKNNETKSYNLIRKVSSPDVKYNEKPYYVKKIGFLLSSCDITLNELSKKTSIDVETLKKYKNQELDSFSPDDVKAIANALNVPKVDILYEKKTSPIIEKISELDVAEIKLVERYIDQLLKK